MLRKGIYQYVKDGVLDDAVGEITEALDPKIRNTCTLQTYAEIARHLDVETKATLSESKQSSSSKLEPPIDLSHKNSVYISDSKSPNPATSFTAPPKTIKANPMLGTGRYTIRSAL